MKKDLRLFIENFIRENAKKDIESGYDLATRFDLSKKLQDELVRSIIFLDGDSIRDLILDHAQNLIDERMPIVETADLYAKGYMPSIDPINGEVVFNKVGGF